MLKQKVISTLLKDRKHLDELWKRWMENAQNGVINSSYLVTLIHRYNDIDQQLLNYDISPLS